MLTANEHFNGPEPKFKRVVLRNVSAETQLTDIQSGQAQVAFDLNSDQVKSIDESMGEISSLPSTRSLYIFNNTDEKIGGPAADPNFRKAVMSAIDYDKLTGLAGEGSQRMASLVPNEFVGAVPKDKAPERDLEKTKKLLEKAGYDGEEIPFHYSSDQAVNGVDLAQLAETLQAQLKEAGINLALKPAPSSTQLDGFRSAKQPMGIGTWGADYPDPTNYNVFIPGGSVADRVNWEGSDSKLEKLAAQAARRPRATIVTPPTRSCSRQPRTRPFGSHWFSRSAPWRWGRASRSTSPTLTSHSTSQKLSENVGLNHR